MEIVFSKPVRYLCKWSIFRQTVVDIFIWYKKLNDNVRTIWLFSYLAWFTFCVVWKLLTNKIYVNSDHIYLLQLSVTHKVVSNDWDMDLQTYKSIHTQWQEVLIPFYWLIPFSSVGSTLKRGIELIKGSPITFSGIILGITRLSYYNVTTRSVGYNI